MAILGSGIQNGSPFYSGYEYTAPNLTAPSGLMTLATLMPKGGFGEKEKTTKDRDIAKGTGEETIVPGTIGTANELKSKLDDIDASIASTRSKMYSKFMDTKAYPTKEMAVEGVKDEYSELQKLYAQKNQLKSLIPAANTDLTQLQTSQKEYVDKGSLGETAVVKQGDIYMSVGKKNNGQLKSYEDYLNNLNESNNLVESTDVYGNKNYEVKTGSYPTTASQKGAFNKEVEDALTKARASNITGGVESPSIDLNNLDEVTSAYIINSKEWSSNKTAVNNAANVLYNKLTSDAKADLYSNMYDTVNNLGDKETTLKSESGNDILTADQVASIKKQADGEDLTGADYTNIKEAAKSYATAKIQGEVPSYLESGYSTKTKLSREGAGKEKEPVSITDETKTIVLPPDVGQLVSATTPYTVKVKTVNISDKPVTMSAALTGTVFNEKTGEVIDTKVGHNTFSINSVDEGVNPKTGKKEKWARGNIYNPDEKQLVSSDGIQFDTQAEADAYIKENSTTSEPITVGKNPSFVAPVPVYKKLTPVIQKKIEDVKNVNLNNMTFGKGAKTTNDTETKETLTW